MAAKFTSKIRNLVASSLVDILSQQDLDEWQPTTSYTEGYLVYYDVNKYICKGSGTSGNTPPTHVNGTVSDGGVNWIWVESLTSTKIFDRNMFVTIGKKVAWDDELVPDDVEINDLNDADVIKNIIALQKINGNNFRLAIRRYNWLSGTVYSQYDSEKDPLAIDGVTAYPHPYYVFTDDSHIYKCINNNNGAASTQKPTATGTTFVYSDADGYVWKYMGSLDADSVYFLTKDFVPVRYKAFDDGSPQKDVQNAAAKQSISTFKILNKKGVFPANTVVTLIGGTPTVAAQAFAVKNTDNTIKQILIDPSNQGTGYDLNSEVIAEVKRSGVAGSGGTVGTITIAAGVITGITVGNAGTGYTSGATLVLYDPDGSVTTEADVNVVITPGNNLQEFEIVDGGAGYSASTVGYVVPGLSGAIGRAIFAPKEGHGFNIVTELCANTCIINVRFTEGSSYFPTGEANAFRQVALVTDVKERTTLKAASKLQYLGPQHASYGSGAFNNIDSNRGYVLYVNNLKKVVRNDGQEEDIKLAITF